MILDKSAWSEIGFGFELIDCAIKNRDLMFFALAEIKDEDDRIWPRKRFVTVYGDAPMDERCYFAEYNNFDTTFIGYRLLPNPELIAIDTHGTVYSYDADRDGLESKLIRLEPHKGKKYGAAVRKLVRVNNELFAICYAHRIFGRVGVNKWEPLSDIPVPDIYFDEAQLAGASGFNDLSAFGSNDVYAAGGHGDIWHFNGLTWRQMPFPTNDTVYNVCCAGDGNVYISTGWDNSIWMGRENRWKRIVEGDMNLPFNDMVWFAGRLWCGNSYGLWFLRDGELVPIAEEESLKLAANCGRLDVSPDGKLMLTASPIGAALYDGEKWEILFNKYQLE